MALFTVAAVSVVAVGINPALGTSQASAKLTPTTTAAPTTSKAPTTTVSPTTVPSTSTAPPTTAPPTTVPPTTVPPTTVPPTTVPPTTVPPTTAPGTGSYDPATDPYSMAALTSNIGVTGWWNAGYTGKGVDVALIDTGVSPVEGLAGAGKIINGPDLSLESQAPNLTRLDTNGHGTFMAGLIAGKDSALTVPFASAPASAYRGIAPDARIISVKVGTADGGVDVSQMIAAVNWVVQHKTDNGMNIRVINLSYGTNTNQSWASDPLSFAVEQAWKAGIVVVVATGNTGYQTMAHITGLSMPSSNPWVIGVGGYDTIGTATTTDDVIGSYSAACFACTAAFKNPDLASVGSHLQGLRVPNGYLDSTHPEGRIGTRYFRGSGTSQSAAITSGLVALILQKYPTMSMDQVKALLKNNAKRVVGWTVQTAGSGAVDLAGLAAYNPAVMFDSKGAPLFTTYAASTNRATGTGTLELSRGSDHLTANGVVLSAEVDIFGRPFNSAAMATAEAAGSSWSGGTWNGSSWSGSSWSGSSWSGSSWSGSSWSGSSWSGSSWSGSSWSGSSWSGSSWSGSSWSGSSWSGSSWSGGSWS